MALHQLCQYFESSPAIRLFRSAQAPFIVDFLVQQFKADGRIAIPYADLHSALLAYQEKLHETDPNVMRDKASTYLVNWCRGETRWLHRTLVATQIEPVYQLTRHTEEVIQFLDRALQQDRGFIGTESRLRLVIETLNDLVVGTTDDPQARLAHLRGEQKRLQDEIDSILANQSVGRYQPAKIREQFSAAVSLLKQLQGDFRAVEEKFKEIARQVQQRKTTGGHKRGEILGFALDAEDILKKEDQGVSFYEFVRFILSPNEQTKLRQVIQALGQIGELSDQTEGLQVVRRMVPLLLAEAEQVMRTNQRLSATLRRLLDVRTTPERQRVSELLQNIRSLAVSLSANPPKEGSFLELETRAHLNTPWSRTFWSPPVEFAEVDLNEHVMDDDRRLEAFRMLAEMQRLDWRKMRNHVSQLVREQGPATLADLLEIYPPLGAIEVLGYLQIANDDGHQIEHEAVEKLVLPPSQVGQPPVALTIPRVTFRVREESLT